MICSISYGHFLLICLFAYAAVDEFLCAGRLLWLLTY